MWPIITLAGDNDFIIKYFFYDDSRIEDCFFSRCEGSLNHDSHDLVFGGKRIYLVCFFIWLVSFATILPDVVGVSFFLFFFIFKLMSNLRKLDITPGLDLCMAVTPFAINLRV